RDADRHGRRTPPRHRGAAAEALRHAFLLRALDRVADQHPRGEGRALARRDRAAHGGAESRARREGAVSWGAGIASRSKPGDKVGDRVHVAAGFPAKGHIRTPFYIRGKTGVVERICGQYRNPEELAFGQYGGAAKVLYRVRFDQKTIWPDYRGNSADTVEVE